MMRLSEIYWITDAQRAVLAKHHVLTLGELASFELVDSVANTIEVDNLRGLARRARRNLGRDDPLRMLGASAGQRSEVVYAGGVSYEDGKG